MAFDYAAKIQGLLANAEDERLPEAARDSYRAMAERLMIQYRIAEEELLATDATSAEPIMVDIVLSSRYGSDLSMWYRTVFYTIAEHTGVRAHIATVRRDHTNTYDLVAHVVGYEGDLRYTEFLWTAAYLMFSTRVDPMWSENRSEAENIYLLRNAGIERRVIADRAWGTGDHAVARSKVQRIYLRECERRGEQPMATGLSHDTKTYRQAYARSFRDTLEQRLRDARDAADSVHGAVTLHGRADRVDAAFYDRFPMYRPSDVPFTPPGPCTKCTPDKPCRKHRWSATDEARWQRQNNSPSARAGTTSGIHAAEGVELARGHTKANRIDSGGRAIEG